MTTKETPQEAARRRGMWHLYQAQVEFARAARDSDGSEKTRAELGRVTELWEELK